MYKFILSFTICFLISTASLFSQHIYDLSQYGIRPNSDKNTSPLIEAAIKQIKTESNEADSIILKFEKGSYHFYEQGATQKEY